MIILLTLLLIVSFIINGILVWYTRKLIQNLNYGVKNVDEFQKLLNEYVTLLEPVSNMENYFGDPVIVSTVANTRMVIEACRAYKNSIIESYDEETQQENKAEEDTEAKKTENQPKATIKAI